MYHKWKKHYFAYDKLKGVYKSIKARKSVQKEDYDLALKNEFVRLSEFVDATLSSLKRDMLEVKEGWQAMPYEQQNFVKQEREKVNNSQHFY